MTSFKYDITGLLKIDRFDALGAVKNFGGYQDYYDKLTEFMEKSRQYLRAYTPSVVIYSEEVQKEFLAELEKTRNMLATIGATSIAAGLTGLNDSIYKKDAGILSDGLTKFYAEMDIITKQIALTRMPDTGDAYSGMSEKQLIFAVDDKAEILTTITTMLESTYKVIAMTNGKVALKALEKHSPSLFLLDIEMPIITGYELAKEIRTHAKFRNTPILFLTGMSSRDAVLTAKANGGNGYILKPVDKDTLLNKIKLHLTKLVYSHE